MSQNRTRPFGLKCVVVGLLAFTVAPAALAFTASVTTTVRLRAGPSTEYPVVTLLTPGTVVTGFGCEQDYGWCDVQAGADRGWVDGVFLQTRSPSGSPVIIASSGVTLGIPLVSFSFGTYWDDYYRGRPWYTRRPYYYGYWNRYPHGRPPPPPRPIVRPPVRPPPIVRPPPRPRPPTSTRPPPTTDRPRPDRTPQSP
jgi:uncharacterized protein YraI